MNKQQDTNLILIVSMSFISCLVFLAFYQNPGVLYDCPPGEFCDFSNFASVAITVFIAFLILKAQNDHRERLARISQSIADIYTYPTDRYVIVIKYHDSKKYNETDVENARKYYEKLVKSLGEEENPPRNVTLPDDGRTEEIKLEKGTLQVFLRSAKPHSKNKHKGMVHLCLATNNPDLLDKITNKCKLAYHGLEWHSTEPHSYPLELIMNVIEKNTRNSYINKLKDQIASNKTRAITYNLIKLKQIKIEVRIERHVMSLSCSASGTEKGFYRAHEELDPEKIISILFGKINYDDTERYFMKALEPAKPKP